MPAAAVIPAPIVKIKFVAVERFVVAVRRGPAGGFSRRSGCGTLCRTRAAAPVFGRLEL